MELPCINISLSLLIFLISLTCIWNPILSSEECDFPAIFNFGDSNSDTGALAATTLLPPRTLPFGETFFHMPTGRLSDGRLLIDFISNSFGLPFLHAYLDSLGANFSHGANFATSGSTIQLQAKAFPVPGGYSSPFYLGLQYDQLEEFKLSSQIIRQKGGIFASLVPKEDYFSKALYTFDIGQNDIGVAFAVGNKSAQEVKAIIPNFINDFVTNIKDIYKFGGRSFWIHNTGPIGCLTSSLERAPSAEKDSAGCVKSYNEVAQYFNYKLKEAILQLRINFSDAAFTYVDVYSVKYSLFQEPGKYGFELPLKTCCGYGGMYNFSFSFPCGRSTLANGTQIFVDSCKNPNVRVNWDGGHYTEGANKFIFDRISSGAFSDPPIPLGMACRKTTVPK